MAYNKVSLTVKDLLNSDYIPEYAGKINYNTQLLRVNIENTINNLRLYTDNNGNTSLGYGSEPLYNVYSKSVNVRLAESSGNPTTGIVFTKADGTVDKSNGIKADTNGKVKAAFDILETSGDVTVNGDLNVIGDISYDDVNLNGIVREGYGSAPVLAVIDVPTTTATVGVTILKGDGLPNNTVKSDILLNVTLPQNATAGYYDMYAVDVVVDVTDLDDTEDGRLFSIAFGDITNGTTSISTIGDVTVRLSTGSFMNKRVATGVVGQAQSITIPKFSTFYCANTVTLTFKYYHGKGVMVKSMDVVDLSV